MTALEDIRHKIDRLDDEIITLLKKRLEQVLLTLKEKEKIEDLGREDQIISKLVGRSEDNETEKYLTEIYQTIFREGKRIQKHLKENEINEKI
ncbi:MAG TPA: chorismate mutase [Clostridiales bacterium]|nr:chorismate mutase [Clostridiales bacterium]HQP70702.1 chorismate mutase [Clostridiales bacterium]